MKNSLLLAALSLAFAGSVFAQTLAAVTTPGSIAAPARAAATAAGPTADLPTAPTTASGVCKDGSTFSAASTQGACRGHGGVDKKAGAPSGAPAASTTASATAPAAAGTAATAKPASKGDLSQMTRAPGGGAGQVWANDSSKVYHCSGDKYYGKTKRGHYLTEADAKAQGFHGDHGKACTQ